jgi:prepilin-type N-terminal cleavage/methylation domain-containing protein
MWKFETEGCARRLGLARGKRSARRGGFTMLEVSLALTILVVALVATTASNMRMGALRRSNRDRVVAQNAVRTIVESLQAVAAEGVLDPSGFGSHVVAALSTGGTLGTTFDVTELTPQDGQAHVGSIVVVTDETATDAELGAELGLPRDLNGDGDALDTNVTTSSHLLPVVVTLRWHSHAGDQRIVHPFYVFGH